MGNIVKFTQGLRHCPAAAAGYDPQALEKLDESLLHYINNGEIQCVGYLLSRHGQIFAHQAAGLLRYDDRERLFLPDSVASVVSISKTVTAVMLQRLVEQSRLCMEQNVADFIPAFKRPDLAGITIFHLLTHVSGLPPDPAFMDLADDQARVWWDAVSGNPDWLGYYLGLEKVAAPGQVWAYSSVCYGILQLIIEKITGESFAAHVQTSILDPLGMTRTCLALPPELTSSHCLTTGDDEKCRPDFMNNTAFQAGFGLSSTMYDIWLYAQALLDGGSGDIFGKNQLHGVRSGNWSHPTYDKAFGLGFQIEYPDSVPSGSFGHDGTGCSHMLIVPFFGFIAISFTPTKNMWHDELMETIDDMVFAGLP